MQIKMFGTVPVLTQTALIDVIFCLSESAGFSFGLLLFSVPLSVALVTGPGCGDHNNNHTHPHFFSMFEFSFFIDYRFLSGIGAGGLCHSCLIHLT